MSDKLNWDLLLRRTKAGNCTLFLDAGACASVLLPGRTLARNWAQKYGCPLDDSGDLVRNGS